MTIAAIALSTKPVATAAMGASSVDADRFSTLLAGAQEVGGNAGQLDFARITPRAMQEAAGRLVADGRATPESLTAAVDLASASDTPDQPINMLAYLRYEAAQNEKSPGGMNTAFHQKAALAVLVRVQREEGSAVVFDHDYPTAPREPTTEEANAKLKQAIEDFRKEARLTPRERMAKKLRGEVMARMKVSEESLKAMPPAERATMEKKIGDEVARRMALLGFGEDDGARAGDDNVAAGAATREDSPAKSE